MHLNIYTICQFIFAWFFVQIYCYLRLPILLHLLIDLLSKERTVFKWRILRDLGIKSTQSGCPIDISRPFGPVVHQFVLQWEFSIVYLLTGTTRLLPSSETWQSYTAPGMVDTLYPKHQHSTVKYIFLLPGTFRCLVTFVPPKLIASFITKYYINCLTLTLFWFKAYRIQILWVSKQNFLRLLPCLSFPAYYLATVFVQASHCTVRASEHCGLFTSELSYP